MIVQIDADKLKWDLLMLFLAGFTLYNVVSYFYHRGMKDASYLG